MPHLREYFAFSRGQRRGLLGLVALFLVTALFFAAGLPLVRPSSYPNANLAATEAQLRELFADIDTVADMPVAGFDPNTLDEEDWRAMGVADNAVRQITAYRNKGGRFYRKEDVLRIYGFTKEDYLRLAPHMLLGGDVTRTGQSGRGRFSGAVIRETGPIEINSADSARWTGLRGVGPVLASRIVTYREAIGGFRSVDDLKSVYGLKPDIFETIRPHLELDSSLVPATEPSPAWKPVLIDLNSADSAMLDALPGIGPFTAAGIIRYRNRLGGFYAVDQLYEVRGLQPQFAAMFLDRLVVDTNRIQRLQLNEAAPSELRAHPYIGQALCDFIVSYRAQHPFQNVTELKKSFLVDAYAYRRLQPYVVP
jgi:DNA uptake protein ComE-like DNA-binding protein